MEDNLGMSIFEGSESIFDNDDFLLEDDNDPNINIDDINDSEGDDLDGSDDGDGNDAGDDGEGDGSETVADEDDDQGEGDGGDTSPNLFSSVATLLHEEGVLPSLDINELKVDSVDDLAKAVTTEVESLYKAKLVERFGEEGYEYVANGVPLKEYQEYQGRNELLGSITEEEINTDTDLSKQVIFQDYVNKGMNEDLAKKYIERISTAGDDIISAQAIESLKNLKEFNKASIEKSKADAIQREADIEAARIKHEEDVKNSIYGTKALADGIPVNKNVQDSVYKLINTVVSKDPKTGEPENALMKARRENPIDFNTKLYYMYEMTKGFTDFSLFGKASKRSTIKDFERAAMSHMKSGGGGNPNFVDNAGDYGDDFGDTLIL